MEKIVLKPQFHVAFNKEAFKRNYPYRMFWELDSECDAYGQISIQVPETSPLIRFFRNFRWEEKAVFECGDTKLYLSFFTEDKKEIAEIETLLELAEANSANGVTVVITIEEE